MKSLISVLVNIFHDVGDECGVSTDRDIARCRARVEEEGLSFLTITLPAFAKSFEQALDRGSVAPTDFPGFKRKSGGLPQFLGGFLRHVFDSRGDLLDHPDSSAIRAVRQICYLFSKIEKECTDRRQREALEQYVKTDQELAKSPQIDLDDLKVVWHSMFGEVESEVSDQIQTYALEPRHGPGATADRLKGNRKWRQREWTSRLEKSFPMDQYLIPNHRYWARLQSVRVLEPREERPVRVVLVPKTMKTPRVIAIEPTCMQYMQQALYRSLRRSIRTNGLDQIVGLEDQEPNRFLARQGSLDGRLATLDLSEASDRVSNQLVFDLMRPYRPLAEAVQACRSKRADVSGFGVIRLRKFASMGSALCFPVEGMVFSAISTLGILRARSLRVSRSNVRSVMREVRVFGDDIIVPSDCASTVSDTLEVFNLKVNRHKSFWNGKFRESCGKDFYGGEDVSVIRFRQEFPRTVADARNVAALFSFRNQCYSAGYWKTVRFLDSYMASLRIPCPRVSETSPVLGRLSFLGYDTQRYDEHLHSPLVRGMKVVARPPASVLNGPDALQKIFTLRGLEPLSDGHLERSGRPDRVTLKVGWGRPF